MKKNILILVSAVSLLLMLNSCRRENGDGPLVKLERTSAAFTGLESHLPGRLFYKHGTEFKIELEGQRNILNIIESVVVNDQLMLKFIDGVNIGWLQQLTITVTSPTLNTIVLNGSGDITTLGTFQQNDIFVHLKGSGNINIPFLVAHDFSAVLNGSGEIKVGQGEVFMEETSSNGSGSIDLRGVDALHAVTSIKGSGHVKLQVQQTLYCRITGSGSVYYKGNPMIETEISGSGRLVKE